MRLLRAYPLISFFVLTYAVTWALWTPLLVKGIPAFSETRHVPSLATLPGIAIGVTGTAFLMTAVIQGRTGVRRLLQRLTWWNVGVGWYVVALLAIPLIELLFTAAVAGPQVFRALTPSALALYPAAFATHFIFGPLFEEAGWRGFAMPRLQQRFGPLRGTLLLGLLWAGWHFFLYAPGWFFPGVVAGVVNAAIFIGFTTTVSVVFTWLSNNTRASLLLVMLLHGSINGTATYVQVLADRGVISSTSAVIGAGFGALFASTALAVLIIWRTHRRLGYPRYRYEAEHFDLSTPATIP